MGHTPLHRQSAPTSFLSDCGARSTMTKITTQGVHSSGPASVGFERSDSSGEQPWQSQPPKICAGGQAGKKREKNYKCPRLSSSVAPREFVVGPNCFFRLESLQKRAIDVFRRSPRGRLNILSGARLGRPPKDPFLPKSARGRSENRDF